MIPRHNYGSRSFIERIRALILRRSLWLRTIDGREGVGDRDHSREGTGERKAVIRKITVERMGRYRPQ